MSKPYFICLVFLLNLIIITHGDNITDGTELLMAFTIFRHGDRTPVEMTMQYVEDPAALEEIIRPYGYGQLTKAGKTRAYNLGVYIRQRYNGLLSPVFNESEIYIRSTDSVRTKMSVLTAMTAVYPAGADPQRWNETINWVPIPYDSMPIMYDPDCFFSNCPKFVDYTNRAYMNPNIPKMRKFHNLFDKLADVSTVNITNSPLRIYLVNDVYVSQLALGMDLPDSIQQLLPQIKQAAADALDVLYGNNEYIALQSGVLLKEFLDEASKKISGMDTPNLRVHSAHDVNIHSFRTICQLRPKLGVPKYGAAISLELRKVLETGQIVVLPVYKPSPEEAEIYLQVEGCEILCDFDQFQQIVEGSTRCYDEWRYECDTDNFVIQG